MGEPGNEGEALAGRTADGRFATGRVRSERERDGVRRADAARTAAGIPSAQGAALSAANARRRAAQAAELETVIEADAQGGRWTTARRLAFLDTLATTGNVTVAARGVGLNARGAYAFGRARVLTGAAAGLEQRIDASDAGSVTLGGMLAGLAPGAMVRLTEGCDKRLITCQGRFGNLPNFRGEPHVPGVDIITQYPGL